VLNRAAVTELAQLVGRDVVARILTSAEARQHLTTVRDRCRGRGRRGVAVFDLDSTLLNNRPRQARIMREFGELRNIASLAGARAEHWDGWDAAVAMANVGLDRAAIAGCLADFRQFWHERFFTSEYCVDDVPVAGAPAYVAAIVATAVCVCYVTGRHEAMRAGTLASFRAGGFPLPDGQAVRLIMKPTFEEGDDDFKLRVHQALSEIGEVCAVFDNEPSHINGYFIRFPAAAMTHLATDHSMRPIRVHRDIPSIEDFTSYCQ
jgi:hypothetical protein